MMRITSLLFIILCFVSCEKGLYSTYDHVKVIGHGGMGISHDFPLNSVESIMLALHKRVDGVEMDVQMTNDSVLVAFHHELLEHSTEDISGHVFDYSWDQLKHIEYEEKLYSEYRLGSLDIVFKAASKFKEKLYVFDIKNFKYDTSDGYYNTYLTALFKIIDTYKLPNTVIEVKDRKMGEFVHRMRPGQRVFFYGELEEGKELYNEGLVEGITRQIDKLTKEDVIFLHSQNIKVATLNTHSSSRNKEAVKYNIDYIQTDMVNYLLRILDR